MGGSLHKASAEAEDNLVLVHQLVEVLARWLWHLNISHSKQFSHDLTESINITMIISSERAQVPAFKALQGYSKQVGSIYHISEY